MNRNSRTKVSVAMLAALIAIGMIAAVSIPINASGDTTTRTTGDYTLILSPATAQVGTTVTVTGSGFSANVPYGVDIWNNATLLFSEEYAGSGNTSSEGTMVFSFIVTTDMLNTSGGNALNTVGITIPPDYDGGLEIIGIGFTATPSTTTESSVCVTETITQTVSGSYSIVTSTVTSTASASTITVTKTVTSGESEIQTQTQTTTSTVNGGTTTQLVTSMRTPIPTSQLRVLFNVTVPSALNSGLGTWIPYTATMSYTQYPFYGTAIPAYNSNSPFFPYLGYYWSISTFDVTGCVAGSSITVSALFLGHTLTGLATCPALGLTNSVTLH